MDVPISEYFILSKEAAKLLQELYEEAIEVDALCMQAPNIWDGDTNEDVNTAKHGCNGIKRTKLIAGYPPCPIRALCLEAAMKANVTHGVWGGTSVHERKELKTKWRRNQV